MVKIYYLFDISDALKSKCFIDDAIVLSMPTKMKTKKT